MTDERETAQALAPVGTLNRKGAARETQAPPRARLLWVLRIAGWSILLTISLLVLVNQVIQVSQGPTDFCTDYTTAQRVLQGVPPYIPLHCTADAASFPPPLKEYNAHPPTSVLLLLPFALLPIKSATLLWGLLSLAAYLASGVLLLRALGWRLLRGMALFAFGSLLWLPIVFSEQMLNLGQALTLLVTAACLFERRGRAGWAGWMIGAASLLKLWPAGLIAGALVRRQGRQAAVSGVVLLVGTALALLVIGPGAYASYLGPVALNERYVTPSDANVSLVAAVARPLSGIPATLPPFIPGVSLPAAVLLGELVAGLVLLLTLGLIWWCARRSPSEPVALLSNGLLITMLLLAFPVNPYWGQVTLLVPGALTILALRQLPRPPRWWIVCFVTSLAEPLGLGWLLIRLPWWLIQGGVAQPAGWVTLLLGVPTLGFLLFALAQAWLLCWASGSAMTTNVERAHQPQGVLDVC